MYKTKQFYYYKNKVGTKYSKIPVGEYVIHFEHGHTLPDDAVPTNIPYHLQPTLKFIDTLDEDKLC